MLSTEYSSISVVCGAIVLFTYFYEFLCGAPNAASSDWNLVPIYMVKIAHRKENQWRNNRQKWVELTIDLNFMPGSKKKSTFVLYPHKSGWMSHQMHVRYGKRDGIIAPTGEYKIFLLLWMLVSSTTVELSAYISLRSYVA